MPPEYCPNCGAEVPPKAKACPECGSDDTTGWSERAVGQRLNLPDDEFDYDEFVKDEFGEQKKEIRPRGVSWFWWLVAIIAIASFVWLMVSR
jgi:predicted nucleic acid-binding Zn ribbon protein